MDFKLITEQPSWLIIICLLIGFLYAGILYYRDNKLNEVSRLWKVTMATFRFVAVSILCFFLLGPFIRTGFREVEKPVIVFAQDNSESLIYGEDTSWLNNEYKNSIKDLLEELRKTYDVDRYTFGSGVQEGNKLDFSNKETDLSSFFRELYTRYSNRNVGAVIVSSDGLYNKGTSPLYAAGQTGFPIYTLALGDTSLKKDLVLNKINYNRLAYLGNQFPVEVVIHADQFKGSKSNVKISRNGQTVFEKTFDIKDQRIDLTVPAQLKAEAIGIQRYNVTVQRLDGESNYRNNSLDFFIEVLDARQKVLILANSPHPDIGAIRQTLENNDNYEVDVELARDFNRQVAEYNLVILHQLPSSENPVSDILNIIEKQHVPAWYIVGAQTSLGMLNNIGPGLSIVTQRPGNDDSQSILNKSFTLFTFSDELEQNLRKFPPLKIPFGEYRKNIGSEVLLNQKIGIVETEKPLMLFNNASGAKTAVLAGEGVWRWKLRNFAEHGNHRIFDEFIYRTVQYLSVKADKSRFRVNSENNFAENKPIYLEAEVYNDSYELINDPEVRITIINEENKKYPFTFSRTAKGYKLNAGNFPVGNYRYEAQTKVGEQLLKTRGEFSISPLQVEAANTVADHQLLFNLARKNGGDMYYASDLESLKSELLNREDIKPVSYYEERLSDLINLKWIFFIILGFLSLEWFARKRSGTY